MVSSQPLNDSVHRRPLRIAAAAAALACAAGWTIPAAAGDAHGNHRHAVAHSSAGCDRSTVAVRLPDVAVVRHDGTRQQFPGEVDRDRPVLLNFVYTSCTAICPPMTQAFAEVQQRLGPDRDKVRMISVSIDPEHDTAPRLRDYATRFRAGGQWRFYTGSQNASTAIQQAFNVYRTDKMGHTPVTFIRAPQGVEWVRIDGFIGPDDVVRELRSMLPKG